MAAASTSIALLQGEHTVIFGAGCGIGTARAQEFAAYGATDFLLGRHLAAIEQVAAEIHRNSGVAYVAKVDALDEQAVQEYLDGVTQAAGSIDILRNAVDPPASLYGELAKSADLVRWKMDDVAQR